MCYFMPGIPTLGRLKQEDGYESKASTGYTVSCSQIGVQHVYPVPKKKTNTMRSYIVSCSQIGA